MQAVITVTGPFADDEENRLEIVTEHHEKTEEWTATSTVQEPPHLLARSIPRMAPA